MERNWCDMTRKRKPGVLLGAARQMRKDVKQAKAKLNKAAKTAAHFAQTTRRTVHKADGVMSKLFSGFRF